MCTYSILPTDAELTNLDDEMFVLKAGANDDLEAMVVAACLEGGYSGAHVLVGGDGPRYDVTGYESNYCGWVDARPTEEA